MTATNPPSTPDADDRWWMPAEFSAHERTVMCWPSREELYGTLMAEAKAAHLAVAEVIAQFEPVTIIARPGADAAEVRERSSAIGGQCVEVVELPLDDSWFRDTGPTYVVRDIGGRRRRRAVDWVFNGWGGKFTPFEADAALAREFAELHGDPVRSVPMVLEGGAITVDGEGTLVTTAQCLLHPNRNPTRTRREIEGVLSAALGATRIHWLPHGLADDADTDGHVDNVATFTQPGHLLLQGCDDVDAPDHERMELNRRWIQGAEDARGRDLMVTVVPVLPFAEIGGRRVPVPYLNYLLGNGFALVPVCGHPADAEMCALIADQHPDRDIIPLDVGAILAFGGGGIHCITQQIPLVDTGRGT